MIFIVIEPHLSTLSLQRSCITTTTERLSSSSRVGEIVSDAHITGIGDGVAIPHGKFQGVEEPIISFGRSLKGLDFESMDGEPVFLFFLLVAPESSASMHLKALARIAKILKNGALRKRLMEVSTRKEIYETIIQDDEEF